MNKSVIVISAVSLIIFGATALHVRNRNSASGETLGAQSVASPTDPATATDTPQVANVKEFTVVESNYKFDPGTIAVNKGDTVKINFQDSDGVHNFVIDEFNVSTNCKFCNSFSRLVEDISSEAPRQLWLPRFDSNED